MQGALGGASSVSTHVVMPQRGLRDDVQRSVVDRNAALHVLDSGPEQMRVGVGGAGDLPEPEPVAVGLARRDRVEHARDVGLGLDVEHRHAWSVRKILGVPPIEPAISADSPGPTSGSPRVRPGCARRTRRRPSSVVARRCSRSRVRRRLRLADGDDSRRPTPPAMPAPERTARPAYRCRTRSRLRAARATRSGRGRSPSGPVRRPPSRGPSTRTNTGPPSTPIRCAETPTQASACAAGSLFVRGRPFGIGIDAAAHVQPLDDDRAAETVGSLGRRTRTLSGTAQCRPARTTSGRPRRAGSSPCTTSPFPMPDVFVLHVPGPLEVHGDRVAEEDTVAAGKVREVGGRSGRAHARGLAGPRGSARAADGRHQQGDRPGHGERSRPRQRM